MAIGGAGVARRRFIAGRSSPAPYPRLDHPCLPRLPWAAELYWYLVMTTTKIDELIRKAVGAHYDDERLVWVCDLMKEDPEQVMVAIRSLHSSEDEKSRLVAAWAMGELGYPQKPFADERLTLLQNMLQNEASPAVRGRVLRSIGLLKTLALRDTARGPARWHRRRRPACLDASLGERWFSPNGRPAASTFGRRRPASPRMGLLGSRAEVW